MTEEEFLNMIWKEIWIEELPDKQECYVLVYDDKGKAIQMLEFLDKTGVILSLKKTKKGTYNFLFTFSESDFTVNYEHPDLVLNQNNLPNIIAVGIYQNKRLAINSKVKTLDRISLS